jgi:hypothetical protein
VRHGVLALGDSVMLGCATDLSEALGPGLTVDAEVGRQVWAGIDRLAQYEAAGRLRTISALVVDLGSNGVFTPADLHQLESLVVGVPLVVLVNVRVPDPWQKESNATIDSVAHRPGYRVVDWYAASGRPGLLYADRVHPDPQGQAVYTALVRDALLSH